MTTNRNAGSSVGPKGGAVTCAPEYGLGSETSQAERRLDKPEVDGSNPSPRTTFIGHTTREAAILRQTLGGLALLRKHERGAQFCFGVAWATLNMILRELGEQSQEMPDHNSSDDPKTPEKQA